MSAICNGVNDKHRTHRSDSLDRASASSSPCLSEEEDLALKTGFRGFEKVPVVLLSRYDITPYLNAYLQVKVPIFESIHVADRKPTVLDQFCKKCTVRVVKQDLEKLKRLCLSNSRSPIHSDTDSINTDSMASLKCKICEKVYSSEKKLQNHQDNKHIIYKANDNKPIKRVSFSKHVIVHQVKEYHKCRKCTRIFEDYKLLKVHMKQQHKKRKCYICNYCDKNFADRMFFKVHIKLHCDVCGLLLPSKSKYIEHRRNVCRIIKKHKCKICEQSFFRLLDLRDHGYEHTTDTRPYFICDICKDQFQSKCALAHHILFLHSKHRPDSLFSMRNLGTERLYLCNFCDESSVERDILEHHLQILPDLTNKAMTGYKDYYFCDQCLKKFATETDMVQHKWTHFLKTNDKIQEQPKSILTKEKCKKTIFKVNEKLPEYMQPTVVLQRLQVDEVFLPSHLNYTDDNQVTNSADFKRALVDPKSKKTILSKHQCQICDKYYSSNYCLNRHMETQHSDYENLRCDVCEETFVWPSLLKSHKCIRFKLPEMPFQDARPEIQIVNLDEHNGFDDFNITDDDYMNAVDFEIPAPVVELAECDSNAVNSVSVGKSYNSGISVDKSYNSGLSVDKSYSGLSDLVQPLHSLGYKLVMQEVPIEF